MAYHGQKLNHSSNPCCERGRILAYIAKWEQLFVSPNPENGGCCCRNSLSFLVYGVSPEMYVIPITVPFVAFNTENVAVPIAPSTPLVLQSVSFRSDKHTFLNKSELRSVVDKGRHKKNLNPNKSRDMILLMTDEEDRCVRTVHSVI